MLSRHGSLHHQLCSFLYQGSVHVRPSGLLEQTIRTSSPNSFAFCTIIHISVLAYVTPSTSNLQSYHCDKKPYGSSNSRQKKTGPSDSSLLIDDIAIVLLMGLRCCDIKNDERRLRARATVVHVVAKCEIIERGRASPLKTQLPWKHFQTKTLLKFTQQLLSALTIFLPCDVLVCRPP